mmetsp:Transcript_90144/g.232687  ORF Transcript_90144/g.232687 Transcript_90144/m.232687 type:complete len:238 (+) Transcript_90144:111-824(+)
MDFDNESLLLCFVSEDDRQKIKEWNEENGHKRSDIFEWRLEKADNLREEGNEFFKTGDYESSIQRYFAAIYHLDFDVGQQWNMMEKHQLDLNTRKLKVLSNVCFSYLKSKDWQNTKKAADVGLRHIEKAELKDAEAKAKFLYRKGIANLERGFTEDAFEDLKKADAESPGDRAIREALQKATKGQKQDKAKAKEVWKGALLTEEEKACQGSWLDPSVAAARFRARLRQTCCRRKKAA